MAAANTEWVFRRCGVLDVSARIATVYDTNSKFRIPDVDIEADLQYIGVLSAVRDCVITGGWDASAVEIDQGIKAVGVRSNDLSGKVIVYNASRNILESVMRPSDSIEDLMKNTASSFRHKYTAAIMHEPAMLYGDKNAIAVKMAAVGRLCAVPVSTVGLKLRISKQPSDEVDFVAHNPSGVAGFNIFNSSPVYFEAHSDMDVLMMMVAFLKHNGVWGEISANMDLFKFDYAGALFDHRWLECADETSFMAARAQLLSSYYRCTEVIKCAMKGVGRTGKKRCVEDDEVEESSTPFLSAEDFDCSTELFQQKALLGSRAVVGGGMGCPHPASSGCHVRLDESGKSSCVACFSAIFFVPKDVTNNFVVCKNSAGAQKWINDRLSDGRKDITVEKENEVKHLMLRLADLTQSAHTSGPLGPCGRQWNWPSKNVSPALHEFILQSMIRSLKEVRDPLLPRMNVDVLYRLLNPFGKMLLLLMHNSLVMTSERNGHTPSPGGTAVGKWWDVNYAGPNLWCFQVTKCLVEKNKSLNDLACLETLHRLPWPGDKKVDDRVVFKGFCRGENLARPGGLVSDITQSVKTIALLLENREFHLDEENNCIKSRPGVGDVMCSLEVTGFRSNRALESANSGRVSARVMRILRSREGARVWSFPERDTLLLENVNHEATRSTEAMERAIANHKVLYYDIETNTVNFTEPSAVITSICCCLCTGGDITKGGERSVFGLAAPGTNAEELAREVRKAYPGFKTEDQQEYIVTDHAPDIVRIYESEFELLLGFAEYVQERRPHVISGWNSAAFDDPFVFTRTIKHLSEPSTSAFAMASVKTINSVLPRDAAESGTRMTTREERLKLARTGLFELEQFMNQSTGYMKQTVSADLLTGATSQANCKFNEQSNLSCSNQGSAGWFQKIMGGCCIAIRLDLMKVCAKAYKESLSEFNLNAVLAKVSNVADRLKNVKDVVDLHYHLLGFLDLKSIKDQATVHVYCCKDAYLAAVVSTSINKEGEIFRLCLDSALIESVVTANLVTPLCIGEGAVCRNMGPERADRRGVGVRRHSIATDTKGGMVSQSLVNHVPYQTIDMTSLYPMTMGQNNLCTSTFVSQRQVIDLRDRMVEREAKTCGETLIDVIDKCNMKVLEFYRPVDIAVASWKNTNTDKTAPVTRLEKRIGQIFSDRKEEVTDDTEEWCANAPPNMAMTAAGLDYFPEVMCDVNMQQAAKVNDDMHISPASLEYLLLVLPWLIISQPHIGAHITAGKCKTSKECLLELEEEFNDEKDAKVIETHWTFAGTPQTDFCSSPVTRMIMNIARKTGRDVEKTLEKCQRISGLLDRIYRRVSVFDSADDCGVRLWASRLINVGMLVRAWNVKSTTLEGIIPKMQIRYRADRVIMQGNVKKFGAAGDLKRAGLNKVGQLTMKLCMNSMYGCLALKVKSSKQEFSAGMASNAACMANSAATGGVGGGTRHSPTANQITENARCVFGNIGCALQQSLPGTKQAYGDTDSVFCVHNIPGDGGVQCESQDGSGRMVYLIDICLKQKLSNIIPILVNSTTKGIRFDERRDAGIGMMSIAHERLALLGLLFAKKTYHMLHFNENSSAYEAMLTACKKKIELVRSDVDMTHIDKFVSITARPSYADEFVVPHNPKLIFRAAASLGGEKLSEFLEAEGIADETSMKLWFTSSPVWIELDATVVNNLYASKIVDTEKGQWIDAETSRLLSKTEDIEAVSQADAAFTLYKKGAFVKKGITASTKLKGLQSLLARSVPDAMEPKAKYIQSVRHHVANFASQTTNPSMMITSARVNKLDPNVAQNRPNPLAMAINNHLNPSSSISLGEKFKTVSSVSAWSLVADPSEIPAGYFNGGVRWNPESMKGSIPFFAVKNLSVIPNAVSTVYDIMDADKKALGSMIKKNADVFSSASATSGFSLREGALSFSTGVIVTNDLAMACIRASEGKNIAFVGGKQNIEFEPVDGDGHNDKRSDEEPYKTATATASFFSEIMDDVRGGILSRLVNSACSASGSLAERQNVIDNAKSKMLGQYVVEDMRLDQRVADQMDALISQMETAREVCYKSRRQGGTYISMLDEMVAAVKVDFAPVLEQASNLTRLHWKKCPVCVPEIAGEEEEIKQEQQLSMGVPFRMALESMAGKYKCTNTCVLACCQSLYFVLLCTLALKFENERRHRGIPFERSTGLMAELLLDGDEDTAEVVMERIKIARKLEVVKTSLHKNYNSASDSLVFLFEPSRIVTSAMPSMKVETLKDAISTLSDSKATGKVWNYMDTRFFGQLADKETVQEEEAMTFIERQLPFVTGVYHAAAVEVAAACLSAKL